MHADTLRPCACRLSVASALPAAADPVVHVGTWSPRLSRARPLVPPSFPFNTQADVSSPAVPVSITTRASGRVDIVTIHGHTMHVAQLSETQMGIGNAVIATGAFYTCNAVFVGTDTGAVAAFMWQPIPQRWSCVGVVPGPPLPLGCASFAWSALEISEDIPGGVFKDRDPRSTRFLLCGVLQAVAASGLPGPAVMFVRNCDVDHTFSTLHEGDIAAGIASGATPVSSEWPMFRSSVVHELTLDWPSVTGATLRSASVCKLPPLVIQLLQKNDSAPERTDHTNGVCVCVCRCVTLCACLCVCCGLCIPKPSHPVTPPSPSQNCRPSRCTCAWCCPPVSWSAVSCKRRRRMGPPLSLSSAACNLRSRAAAA